MRTTIDLPDDLHRYARSLALETNRSMSAVVADLIRMGLRGTAEPTPPSRGRRGMPVVSVGRRVTADDVRSLDDDE